MAGVWTLNGEFMQESEVFKKDLAVRTELTMNEQAEKVIRVAGLSDMRERTRAKLVELWEDWTLWKETIAHTVSLLPTVPPVSTESPFFPASLHFLTVCLLNFHLERLISRDALAAVLTVLLPASSNWVKEPQDYLLLGLAWKLGSKDREKLTLEGVMLQLCTHTVPSISSLSQRQKTISRLVRSVLPYLTSLPLPIKPRDRYLLEKARSALRQSASPAAYQTLSEMEALHHTASIDREVKGIRTYQYDGTSWASVCSNLHSPIQIRPESRLSLSSSLLVTREVGKGEGLLGTGRTTDSKPHKGRERPKTAGALPRTQSVQVIRPQRPSTAYHITPKYPPTAPKSESLALEVVGLGAAAGPSPCLNEREHLLRVFSREATPWVAYKWKGSGGRVGIGVRRSSIVQKSSS